ncbi:MAG: class I SAM-dependent RNA methyltransferase [Betaproteobacteria bacterium]|nr:MAG: class I SAM-dependent RNA methyltransferase [Betaproteobacteria bacterium]
MMEHFFAPCPRGLEDALAAELAELGADDIKAADGGVAFGGPIDLAYRANLESRLASRILWQVGHGAYRDEQDIYRLALGLDWPQWFRAERTLRVDVAATRSPLTSLEFATLRIKDAVCDRHRAASGVRPSVSKDQPDVRVHAYLTAGEATFYLDTSGEPLFKRGYRRQTAEAPLRENLAAGLLRLARWQPGTPLLDPLCGSGTIAIEAALIALDIAPGLRRTFGFQKLGWYDGPAWQRIKQAAQRRMRAVEGATIYARDVDEAAIPQPHVNIEAAGVAGAIAVEQIDALVGIAPAKEGTIVTNPPYGVRLAGSHALAELYPRLGDALKRRFAGWTAFLLSGDTRLPKLIGLKASRRTPLFNGALECRLYEYRLIAGSMRQPRPVEAGDDRMASS